MEKIVNMLERMESSTRCSTYSTASEKTKKENCERAKKIIAYLRATYPAKTANIYNTTEQVSSAINLWAAHLYGIEDEYVNRAMQDCVDKFAWCPDVAEFKQLCMSYKGSSKTPWAEDVLKFEKPKHESLNNRQVGAIIDEGAEICKKLKEIYPDKTWMGIAGLFTELKKKARIYHPGLDDIKLIRELMKYSRQDVIDALSV